jgi:short-subunit dehydrogenase
MENNKHTVLITGASGGIGYEFALLFAKNGHDLILVARSGDRLYTIAEELRQQYGIRVAAFARDLSDLHQVQSLYDAIQQEGIFVDFLVNNAGFGDYGFFAESSWVKSYAMIQLNISSLTMLTYLFVQDMKKQGRGRILNVASTASFQPGPMMAIYYATKSYVLHLSEALYNELAVHHISVTTLCPGPTETGFQQEANLGNSRLVKGKKLPTAATVAEYGFMAMMQGKRLAIPGLVNKMMVFFIRFIPRGWVLKIVRWMQEPKG